MPHTKEECQRHVADDINWEERAFGKIYAKKFAGQSPVEVLDEVYGMMEKVVRNDTRLSRKRRAKRWRNIQRFRKAWKAEFKAGGMDPTTPKLNTKIVARIEKRLKQREVLAPDARLVADEIPSNLL